MKLYDSGVYLVNGTELVADDAQAAAAIKSRTGREVAKAEACLPEKGTKSFVS